MAPTDEKKTTKDSSKSTKEELTSEPKAEEPKVVAHVPITLKQELRTNLSLIDRAVSSFEPRFAQRVLRTLTTLRKKLVKQDGEGVETLKEVMKERYPKNDATHASLLALLPPSPPPAQDSMDVDAASTTTPLISSATATTPSSPAKPKKEPTEIGAEVDIYFRLLVTLVLIDSKQVERAATLSSSTAELIQNLNRRSLDHLAAKVYFYLGRSYELLGRDAEVRPLLLAALQTATLRHDTDLQSTLLNLLLRNYFNHNLLDQADKLVSKSTFPESAGNAQLARYLYYLGRIRAVQLNYTEAHTQLQQAIRRAPSAHIAPGFLQTAYKFFIVVELLMGNIPERSTFRLPVLKTALIPYFQIVQAVRIGDLSAFQAALTAHTPTFQADSTLTLILRLRHNVIKTGIHQISLAYSKISLKDICIKLQLDNEEDAEYIVSKAIRDGVIQGVGLDHEKGWMVGRPGGDGYETGEPRKAFHQRIEFCLDLHNQSVKAMRYPLNAHRKDLASGDAARERERELASEIAEGGEMDEDDADF